MKYKTLKALFTGICDAVRTKKGITGEIDHQEIPDEILSIVSTDLSGVTATVDDVVSPKVFVDVNGNKQTGTIPTRSSSDLTVNGSRIDVPAGHYPADSWAAVETTTQATPSITVDSNGLITAKSTQSEGYVSAGEKSATQQLTVQAGKTVTPTKSEQTAVASERYTTGEVKVAAIPDNYIDTSGADATADDIVSPKTAYVDGVKLTGTNPYEKTATDSEVSAQAAKIAELSTILDGKAGGGGAGAPQTIQITINATTSDLHYIMFTSYENNVLIPKSIVTDTMGQSVVIDSIVNSFVMIFDIEEHGGTPIVSDNLSIQNVNQYTETTTGNGAYGQPFYVVTINSGTTGTITI